MFLCAMDKKLSQFSKAKKKIEGTNLLFSMTENFRGNVSFRHGWTQRLKQYDPYSIIFQLFTQFYSAMAVF